MAPSFSGNVLNNYDTKIGKFSKIGLQDEGCPPGMVPIMKIKSNRLRNEYSHSKYHSKNFTDDNPSQQYATYHTKSKNRINHGARAIFSLDNPSVEMGQYSMAQIWVQNGQFNGLESIQVGWAVDPVLYGGDTRTRITTFWTVDNFGNTGCFNTECPGFVQVHPRLHPGSLVANVSVFQGQQFVADILIAQRNSVLHGGSFQHSSWSYQRDLDYLSEFHEVQEHLSVPVTVHVSTSHDPPPAVDALYLDSSILH
ncbi:protein neprosin-like [Castanea sativa]|uniref:protein neprosin-like n=1 Tax=Castanea sativa TaxID=21020 RepID=UPI003F650B89